MANLNNLNHFARAGIDLNISRSKFDMSHGVKTTILTGDLVPFDVQEIIPGDTFQVNTSAVIRSLTPLVPVMDNAFMDLYYFWVPSRLCTKDINDWPKICGQNFSTAWANPTEATLENTGNMMKLAEFSHYTAPARQVFEPGSVANYMGLPSVKFVDLVDTSGTRTELGNFKVSTLPFRAYGLIWNEWFRDQNTQAPIDLDSFPQLCSLAPNILKVSKFKDLYTSVLPSPQKGESVLLPLGSMAPVITGEYSHGNSGNELYLEKTNGDTIDFARGLLGNLNGRFVATGQTYDETIAREAVVPSNLYADLQNATAASINQLRMAFALQRMFEKDSQGTRYFEILRNFFGTTVPDLTLMRPEYLGGRRIPLNITQVLQTSEYYEGQDPLGTTGAYGQTNFSGHDFSKSFNEFGYVIGVCCVRTMQSYSQGIPKLFERNRRYDFYWSTFANIGEQPLYKRELFVGSGMADIDSVFGYNEAWAHYRFNPTKVTGELAPNAGNNDLTPWTYTNNFSTSPVLNSDFMKQPREQYDDTLAVTNSKYHFICDFWLEKTATRPMPVYSIPGLIDHH